MRPKRENKLRRRTWKTPGYQYPYKSRTKTVSATVSLAEYQALKSEAEAAGIATSAFACRIIRDHLASVESPPVAAATTPCIERTIV